MVNFENTVIVMTTNAGSSTGTTPAGFGNTSHEAEKEKTQKALLDFLRPEFINRIDEIITFRSLEKDDFVRIAGIMLNDLADALLERGVQFAYTDAVCSFIAENSFSKKYGARNMRRYIQTEIEDKLANAMIFEIKGPLTSAKVDVVDSKIQVACK